MSALNCLADPKNPDYAIEVQPGETVKWIGNWKKQKPRCDDNQLNGCAKFRIQSFTPHLKDGVCGDPDNADSPFIPDVTADATYTPTKQSVVSQSVTLGSCFKHVIKLDDGTSIDPHIIIGGSVIEGKKPKDKNKGY